jgi:hypothetical protein
VWESVVNGQQHKFHLAGINNQNFIMRDEETGSWWQQVSGEAVQGSLKGQKLTEVFHDELTFALWKREHPNGRVLRPDEKILTARKYESADWEQQVAKMPVRIDGKQDNSLPPRALIGGITIHNQTKAYPIETLEKQKLILDMIGGTEIAIFLGEDKKSVRAFERKIDGGKTLEFFVKPDTLEIVDAETGSSWDFSGKAVKGELTGAQLKKIFVLKDFWFDWKNYHPDTAIYGQGLR